jgi:LacI family transcriptional regulator
MTQRAAPTLDDVARMAGVSTATVSRCLNTPDRVIERTRAKVLDAVKALGYSPNFGARALAAKRTNTIGAVIPTMENAIFARGLQAFQEELGRLGYVLLVASSSYSSEAEDAQIRSLVSRGADGLLLIGHDRDPAILDFLQVQGVPTLVAWAFDLNSSLPSIGFDNRVAMRTLADETISLGHRDIAVITAPTQGNDRARMRLSGVRDAMTGKGLDPDRLVIRELPYSIENGQKAFAELMALKEPPTVVICGNDVLAIGAMIEARRLGLQVPKDVSITGFDDIELARVVDPGLTTVHVPHRDMGARAAKALVDMVTGQHDAGRVELQTEIRWRGSLAAPGAGVR